MSLDKFNFVKKVDKEEGKGLSTNDYTDIDKAEVQNLRTNKTKAKQIQVEDRGSTPPNSPDVQTALENIFTYMQMLDPDEILNIIQNLEMDISGKVDKVAGKGLSTNDYTTAEKNKLAGIAAGAQVNPGVATTSANGLMSSADKTKLNGIAAGATALALGTTSSTAYRGDRGLIAYNHSQSAHAPSNAEPNRAIATQAQAQAGTNNTTVMTPLRVAQAISSLGGAKINNGQYTGNGSTNNRDFTVGFTPKLVIVNKNSSTSSHNYYIAVTNAPDEYVSIINNGFRVLVPNANYDPNKSGTLYGWVAIG